MDRSLFLTLQDLAREEMLSEACRRSLRRLADALSDFDVRTVEALLARLRCAAENSPEALAAAARPARDA